MNNNNEREEINETLNNYITYSREYLILAHNMLAFSSRNDERLYNLMNLYLRNNHVDSQFNSSQFGSFNNTSSIPNPSMINTMHRNNNSNSRNRFIFIFSSTNNSTH